MRNSRNNLSHKLGLLFCSSSLLISCALPIEQRSQQICSGCTPHRLDGPMLAYSRNLRPGAPTVHVYFEGDGQPFLRASIPANNPNSVQLLALHLMQQDPAPSIYLNRPCYGLNQLPPSCSPERWTSQRYSSNTLAQLQNTLQSLAQTQQLTNSHWVLIGHSGGGALAMLLAATQQNVAAVITLAGNLDTAAWAQRHQYTPLAQSLNPAQQAPLPSGILRWHFAGQNDTNLPPDLIKTAANRDPLANFTELNSVTHTTGWDEIWPNILNAINQALAKKTVNRYSAKPSNAALKN